MKKSKSIRIGHARPEIQREWFRKHRLDPNDRLLAVFLSAPGGS